jgi:acetyl-CoA carboxylase beta subunit
MFEHTSSQTSEVLASAALGNITAHISNSQEATALAMSNFGIPLTGGMTAGFAVGFMKG